MRQFAAVAVGAAALAMATAAEAQQQQVTPGGPEIWDMSDASAPRHWFTGLRCPAETIQLRLSRYMAFDSSGADVGCFYQHPQSDDYVTVYATRRFPLDAPLETHVERTWGEVRGRYQGASELADGVRTIATPAGDLEVRELVLQVSGRDTIGDRQMRGVTGAWLADVGGWTLKARVTGGAGRDLAWARGAADSVLTRAAADMNTARECVGAGTEAPSTQPPRGEDAMTLTLTATTMSMMLTDAVPRTPEAARAAGFVCLGEALQTRSGRIVVSVTPRAGAERAASEEPSDMRLLALGEIRDVADAPMVAVFDMDAAGFGAGGGRVHVVYAFGQGRISYLGAAEHEPRLSAAYGAAQTAEGAAPAATVE